MSQEPASLQIVHYPHPSLRVKAHPVDEIDDEVRAVATRMLQLMHEADGVGLAAPQVALPWRLFVTNGREADPHDRVYINPQLKHSDEPLVSQEEGCLSLPGILVQVRRPPSVKIEAIDLNGEPIELAFDGLAARICQHENDHLNGVLIIDRMSPLDRLATRKILKEMKAAAKSV